MGLAENAAARAASADGFGVGTPEPAPVTDDYTPIGALDVPDPDPNGYEDIPVHLAWLKVRAEIKSIAKDREFQGQNWKFRGIEDALNAFGPVTLRHGVNVFPHRVESSFRDARTSTGKPTRECTVKTTYRIYGPRGDYIETEAVGESLDSGDRGSSKAQSVALRELLFGAGLMPTGDPTADVSTVERGEAPVRDADSYMAEVFNPATTLGRLQQIYRELVSSRLRDVRVRNEVGESESIGELVVRIGKERRASSGHVGHEPGGYSEHCPKCAVQQVETDRELAEASA